MMTKNCECFELKVDCIGSWGDCISVALYDKRLSQEIDGEVLGDEFKGYVFRITGGNDKQGFTMKQGILCDHRVRLLLKGGWWRDILSVTAWS